MNKLVNSLNDFRESQYNEALLMLIPNLKRFTNKSGGEGTVYFIDEDFVVKEFALFEKDKTDFQNYLKEFGHFSELGYLLPKIYSSVFVPNEEDLLNCYVLEERIKGKELFEDRILCDSYNLCKDFCSKFEFNVAINNGYGLLFEKIVETYLRAFIDTNEKLAEINDSNLENFILSDYYMNKQQLYSMVDLKSDNVIFDGKKLTHIDLAFSTKAEEYSDNEYKIIALTDILKLFKDNKRAYTFVNNEAARVNNLVRLNEENRKLSAKVVSKFVGKTNKLLSPAIKNKYDYTEILRELKDLLEMEDVKKVIENIEKSF